MGLVMNSWIPVFEPEDQTPEVLQMQKRRGVTVVTEYGRAVTFGVPRHETEHFMKAKAEGKDHEVVAAMQEHKAAKIEATRFMTRKQ